MTDKENREITEGISAARHERTVAQMDNARVSLAGRNQTLPGIGLDDLRDYVNLKTWIGGEKAGINFNVVSGTGRKLKVGKTGFHVLAKELVLSGEAVYVTSLSNLLSATDRSGNMDADVWFDEYDHLMITNFFTYGVGCPFTDAQRQRITDYIQERHERGCLTHIQINGFTEKKSPNLTSWYGSDFWNWFKEVQQRVDYSA